MVSLPAYGFSQVDHVIDLGLASARTAGGLIITSRRSDPLVAGRMVTGDLSSGERSDLVAFLTDCVDRHLRIDWVHPRQPVPRAYTVASLPFSGAASLASLTDLRTLSVADLPTGLILKRGDRIMIEQDGFRACRFVQADLVVASEIAQAVPITPRLPIGVFTTGADIAVKNAALRFMVEPGSIEAPETYAPAPVSFSIVEVLK